MLEEALLLSGNNLQGATLKLQKDQNPTSFQFGVNMNTEEEDVPMMTKTTIKSSLIGVYLNFMEKVASREEAVKLTKTFLMRYKGTIHFWSLLLIRTEGDEIISRKEAGGEGFTGR